MNHILSVGTPVRSDRKASKRTALGLNLPFIGGFTLSALAWVGLIYLALSFFD